MAKNSFSKIDKVSPRRRVLYLTGFTAHALHRGIVDYSHDAGWILNNNMAYFDHVVPTTWQPDGVLCRHSYVKSIIDYVKSVDVPLVGFEEIEGMSVPRVYYDDEKVGAMAAQHLLERGYETLCFLHLKGTPFQMPRCEGFRKAVEAAGARFVLLEPERSEYGASGSWAWLEPQIEALEPPIGIMATNDQVGRWLLEELDNLNLAVPEQIAVVSAENDEMVCQSAVVPMSSVDTNTYRVGYEAAALLGRLMDGAPAPDAPILIEPSRVVVRESSEMVATDNLHAAQALHFIWQRYRENITVADIAAVVPVTRRRLQRVFLDHVGRTMQQEVARVRLVAACRLLSETGLQFQDIGQQVGFTSRLQMHRAFQGRFGFGPREYRKRGCPEPDATFPAPG